MKKLLTGLFALTMIVSVSQAQDKKDNRSHRKHHHEMLDKKLNFSDEQKKQLKDINADFKNQLAELKKNDQITVKEFNSRKETIRKQHQQKMQALLTPDQKSQLEKMKQERVAKHEERSKKGMEKMKEKLNLSEVQASKLKAAHESFASKAKEIKSNQSLTDEQKKEQFKVLAQQRAEETRSILSKEQLEQLQQMHKGKRERSVK